MGVSVDRLAYPGGPPINLGQLAAPVLCSHQTGEIA
jgi:hypothetical protein